MDQAQLQTLLDRVGTALDNRGTGRKVTPFERADPIEWATWRRNFEITVTINNWGDQRARRELAAAMVGTASLAVRNIPTAADVNVQPIKDLLDAYEAKFAPASNSDAARSQFRHACQKEDESLLEYHGRLLHLFCRAYPDLDNDVREASLDLRDQFVDGIRDSTVRERTALRFPDSYAEAYTHASSVEAVQTRLGRKKKASMEGMGVFAFGQEEGTSPFRGTCFRCGGRGHRQRDCPSPAETRTSGGGEGRRNPTSNGKNPSYSKGGQKGQRGRGRPDQNRWTKVRKVREGVFVVEEDGDAPDAGCNAVEPEEDAGPSSSEETDETNQDQGN